MTRIYFIRHGKTQWNLQSRYQGAHGDSPLLKSSYQEIELLAKSLNNTAFAHVYASPLKRARVTAMTLLDNLEQTVPFTIDSRLREFDLGLMEGMHFSAVAEKWPAVLDSFRHHPDRYDASIVQSESFPEVIARVGQAVKEYARCYSGNQNLLIVSHGAALNAAINGLLAVPMAHLKDRGGLSNTSTTILRTDDAEHFELEKWNDTTYLHKEHLDINREEQKKQTQKLVHRLVMAIDEEPDKFNNYYDLGALLTRLNDFEQAEELFMKALGIFEKKNDAKAVNLLNYGLGNVYYSVGKINEAIKQYNKIDDAKLKADSYLMLAQSYMKQKNYQQAVAYGLTAHDLRPQDPEINQAIGDSLLALGEFKQAKNYYDLILKRHPGRADTQFNRGLVAMVLGEPYQDYLNQSQQLDPDYYAQSEKRISDIEHFLQKQSGQDK